MEDERKTVEVCTNGLCGSDLKWGLLFSSTVDWSEPSHLAHSTSKGAGKYSQAASQKKTKWCFQLLSWTFVESWALLVSCLCFGHDSVNLLLEISLFIYNYFLIRTSLVYSSPFYSCHFLFLAFTLLFENFVWAIFWLLGWLSTYLHTFLSHDPDFDFFKKQFH